MPNFKNPNKFSNRIFIIIIIIIEEPMVSKMGELHCSKNRKADRYSCIIKIITLHTLSLSSLHT